MTKFADDGLAEAARKRVADARENAKKSHEDYAERMAGKPTPSQEENDLAAEGAHIIEHDADGSPPDPHGGPIQGRAMEAKPTSGGSHGYETRATTSKPAAKPPTPSSGL
jgi:hypothetical protein